VATTAKNSLAFKDVPYLIWSALPEKAIKGYCKRLQACVSTNSGNFEHIL